MTALIESIVEEAALAWFTESGGHGLQSVTELSKAFVLAVLLASLGMLGCADDHPSQETSSSATTSTTDAVTTGSAAVWPEAWFGDYYVDPGWPLGVPLTGDCSPGWFENIRVEDGSLTVEGITCRGDTVPGSGATYRTEPMGDALQVLPAEPDGDLVWLGDNPFARIVLRPGEACDELRAEFVAMGGQSFEGRWLRGRLCLVDPFDEAIANDTYLIDRCPDAMTECDGP